MTKEFLASTDYPNLLTIRGIGSFTMHAVEIGDDKTLCSKRQNKFPMHVPKAQRSQFNLCKNCWQEIQ
jgi:hypothetical protein